MEETIATFGPESQLIGILTKPIFKCRPFTVLLLNSGLIHNVGPSTIYVQMARQLAEMGIPSFRFDFSGIGDSEVYDTSLPFSIKAPLEVRYALDYLEEILTIKEFVVVGICSGAEMAFKTTLEDKRVTGCVCINGVYLQDIEYKSIYDKAAKNLKLRYYYKSLFKLSKWIKLVSGKSKVLKQKSSPTSTDETLDSKPHKNVSSKEDSFPSVRERHIQIIDQNKKLLYLFSEGSVALDIFNLLIKVNLDPETTSKIDLKILKNADHSFTLLKSQYLLKDYIFKWLLSLYEIDRVTD